MSNTSEFACEVVKVIEVLPHPNAERLEIIRFATKDGGQSGYQVMSGKGQFKAEDLAGYVSVDALVPLVGDGAARWDFLKTNPSYKEGAARFRIKAIRLRGLYSEGVLVPLDTHDLHFGDDLQNRWNILKWERPDTDQAPGEKVPQIPRKKTKILASQFPVYEITSFRKCPFAIATGEPVILTEKIHGTNFRCGWLKTGPFWNPYQFVVGSHRAIKTELWTNPITRFFNWLTGKTDKQHYYKTDTWSHAAAAHGLQEKLKKHPGIVLYGELYGRTNTGAKIQNLTYGPAIEEIRFFDAYDSNTGKWLTWNNLTWLLLNLGLEDHRIPVLGSGIWSQDIDLERVAARAEDARSTLDADTSMEGIVVRSLDKHILVKYVSQSYYLNQEKEQ